MKSFVSALLFLLEKKATGMKIVGKPDRVTPSCLHLSDRQATDASRYQPGDRVRSAYTTQESQLEYSCEKRFSKIPAWKSHFFFVFCIFFSLSLCLSLPFSLVSAEKRKTIQECQFDVLKDWFILNMLCSSLLRSRNLQISRLLLCCSWRRRNWRRKTHKSIWSSQRFVQVCSFALFTN